MAQMTLETAVSAPESTEIHPCLLPREFRETYRCAETAVNMNASEAELRSLAYWQHYRIHSEAYVRWTMRHHWGDPLLQPHAPYDAASEVVVYVLNSFYQALALGQYDSRQGLPCVYIKRSIHNRYQDLLKRGHHPTADECERCWLANGSVCVAFRGAQTPWQTQYQRCYRLPTCDYFDPVATVFAEIGLQDSWPPLQEPLLNGELRPVEETALAHVLSDGLSVLMLEGLSADQHTVLVETYWGQKSSHEIALLIEKSPANVDQIRKRALAKLYRLLMR